MLQSLDCVASSRILWQTHGNISHVPFGRLTHTRMPSKLITLASYGFTRRQAVASQSCATPKSLPLDVPVDEETIHGYDPKNFYHPNPGDVLDHRYMLKAKIGWGTSSTVWLAQDVRA